MTSRPDSHAGATRSTWVVVPARDEELTIAATLASIATAAESAPGPVHLVVVDDGSTDGTAAIVGRAIAAWAAGPGVLLEGPAAGAGWSRRTGLDHALAAAAAHDEPGALIATTDADTIVPPEWLAAMHGLLDRGAEVLAGDVLLEASADPQLVAAREHRVALRLGELRDAQPLAAHPHFAGSNLGFTARALGALRPLPAPFALEDEALHARCLERGLNVTHDDSFAVRTSARTHGRAAIGLATALAEDERRLRASASAD